MHDEIIRKEVLCYLHLLVNLLLPPFFFSSGIRKYKLCPYKGCTSKPQKRLAAHIMICHKDVTPTKRRKMCAIANVVNKKFIKPAQTQRKLSFSKSSSPKPKVHSLNLSKLSKTAETKGTRNMEFYPLSKLSDFVQYLTTLDGGKRTQSTAELIAKDISKFLYFADSKNLNFELVLDKVKLLQYFEYLRSCIQAEGILTKMERMSDLLKYLKISSPDPELHGRIASINETLTQWKVTLRREKKKKAIERNEALSNSKIDMKVVQTFINNEDMWSKFDEIIEKCKKLQPPSFEDKKFCSAVVMISTLYESWQRPGAVRNVTLSQFHAGTVESDDGVYIVSVTEHKTGIGGTAKLMFNTVLKGKVMDYINYIRCASLEQDNEDNDYLFLSADGKQYAKISNTTRYLSNYLKINLPSATSLRKGGATAAAEQCSDKDVRLVTRQLAHDPRVHSRFYECIRGKEDAKKAYKIMKSVMTNEDETTSDKTWTEEQTKIVLQECKSFIDKGKPPRINQVKNISVPNKSPKQVVDKCRTIIRQNIRRKTQ